MTGSFALTLIAKATFIFIAGTALAALLRDSSASVRRSVWALTLAAAASLPIGMIATPAWRVAVLPSAFNASNVSNLANVKNVANVTNGTAAAVSKGLADIGNAITPQNEPPSRSITNAITSTGLRVTELIAIVWLLGVAAVLLRILSGVVGLRSVTRRATNAAGESWNRIIRIERDRILPGQKVRVLVSGDVSTPLTFGAVTPVILLPDESETWSDEHRAVVLRHEMAHIATGDTTVCFAAAVACALYWFHPMAWVAAGRLRREQERACDDRVLEMGTPAADYATHLLEVARSARALGMPGFVSVAMARPSQLEGRLLAVLNEKGPRGTLTRAARVTAYAASAVVMLGVSAVQLEARAAAIVTTFTGPALVTPTATPAPATETREVTREKTGRVVTQPQTESNSPIDSTITGFVTVSPGGVLVLDLETGAGVRIVGTDENVVRMRALLGGRDWRNTDIRLSRTEDGALIETRYIDDQRNQSSSHRIEVSVPRRFSVRLKSAGGSLVLRDVSGEFSGSTGGGEIDITRAGGRADLSTGGGSVSVTNSSLSGWVGTGGGTVTISGVTGGLRGSSGTGEVYYGESGQTFISGARGQGVTTSDGKRLINKSGGSVSITSADGGAQISTGGGAISIGTSDGDLSATTGGGDISVATMRGNGNLSTGAGDVSVNVSGSGAHSVKVTSGNGKIILTLPADISATLDIETAYTRSHGPTRIESDWDVPITETREWDSTEGTPRRYVRSNGRIGSGKGRIRVRTVNGNVVIRRSR